MHSASTYEAMKSYLTRVCVCVTRKFEMAVLHWKQGLLCDKITSQHLDIISKFSTLYYITATLILLNNLAETFISTIKAKTLLFNPLPDDKILDWSILKQLQTTF